MKLIAETNYAYTMDTEVLPHLQSLCREDYMDVEGGRLRYRLYTVPQATAVVVICHGFTECMDEYREVIWYLTQAGLNVAIYEQRGHGYSLREHEDLNIVHIRDFGTYVSDLHAFTELARSTYPGCKLYLYGFSMGGLAAALALEDYPEDYDRAVLNCPMLEVAMPAPVWTAKLLAQAYRLIGKGRERLFFMGEYDEVGHYEGSVCSSRARYDYDHAVTNSDPLYRMSAADYDWAYTSMRYGARACRRGRIARIKTPLLMVQARDDTAVSPRAEERFMHRLQARREGPASELIRMNCKHAVFEAGDEVLAQYWREILRFYQADSPRTYAQELTDSLQGL